MAEAMTRAWLLAAVFGALMAQCAFCLAAADHGSLPSETQVATLQDSVVVPPPPPPPPPLTEEQFKVYQGSNYCSSVLSATNGEVDKFWLRYFPADEDKRALEAAMKAIASGSQASLPSADAKIAITPHFKYPASLGKSGLNGTTTLLVAVSKTGLPLDALVACSDDEAFSASALASIHDARFVPAIMGGVAVTSVVWLPINFQP